MSNYEDISIVHPIIAYDDGELNTTTTIANQNLIKKKCEYSIKAHNHDQCLNPL